MDPGLILNLAVTFLALALLGARMRAGASLSSTVLLGLVLGIALGGLLQGVYGRSSPTLQATVSWVGVVGGGYVRLLQLIVMPLVLVSIVSAVTKLSEAGAVGRISVAVLGVLLLTTALSAAIGVAAAHLFGLSAEGLVQGSRELARAAALESRAGELADLTIPQLLLSFVPANIFADLTGARPTSIVGVVLTATLLGLATLRVRRERPDIGDRVLAAIESLQHVVMQLVRMVIRLTPYGVLALMTRVVATSNFTDVISLLRFAVASYVGLAVILVMHAALLAMSGANPLQHFRHSWPVLTFAFTSRSSAAAIPLNVQTQVEGLGISPGIANFAATFGATIGQNGCAGLYPAMLAVMIAPSVGVDATSVEFVSSVIAVATIGSFGIAGVGGGATFAAILVLSTLGLPIALAALLISIEPLIDMGRTVINVNGSMTAGAVAQRLIGSAASAPAGALETTRVWVTERDSAAVSG